MTNEDLLEIEARANAATPGPWMQSLRFHVVTDDSNCDDIAGTTFPIDADFIAHARADIPPLVAEVRRLQVDAAKTTLDGLGVQALVARIEGLEAENAALKKRIEESARTHKWVLMGTCYELWLFGVWLYSRFSRFGDEGDVQQRIAETETRVRAVGYVRPIDTITRPEVKP